VITQFDRWKFWYLIDLCNNWKVVPCSVSNGEQWFVGGSGALTSKSIPPSSDGFSESAVDIEVFTSTGALDAKQVVISPNELKPFHLTHWHLVKIHWH
jgi:hypothetical protein